MDAETLRRKHRPAELRVLFVGESPPANGTFFYAADSNLFHAMAATFAQALGKRVPQGPQFLEYFQAAGCYLEDLCLEPVNRLKPPEKRRAHKNGEALLAERLAAAQTPAIVIAVLVSIEDSVKRALALAGLADVPLRSVPFPGRWHREEFRTQLAPILKELRKRKVLELPEG